ncbi:MAG: transketolase C-terminal domain-containing protein, partial [Thermoguttaceae bacterium]
APGDSLDVGPMLDLALTHDGPTAIRYPKAMAESIERQPAPMKLGTAETVRQGADGTIVACGGLLSACVKAADHLAAEGLQVGIINARFVKPLDTETILQAVDQSPFVLTVEEGALMGGFGSAVLEAACDGGLDTRKIRRLGIPDQFVEHGTRDELLGDLGLDSQGIAAACREAAEAMSPIEGIDQLRAS